MTAHARSSVVRVVLLLSLASACANVPPLDETDQTDQTDQTDEAVDGGRVTSPPGSGGYGSTGGAPPASPTTAPTAPATPTMAPTQPPTEGLVEGLSVRGLIAAQSVEAPIDPDRGVTAVPIVAGKEVVVHALVDAAPGFTSQTVRAVLEVDAAVYEDTLQVTGSSNPDTLDGAFRFDLPAEAVTTSARIGLRLLTLNSRPERQPGHPASWPLSGARAPLGAVTPGRLKLVIFPVLGTQFGARNNEFHATPERIAGIRRAFLETYPLTESSFEIEVRPTYRFNRTTQGSCIRWDDAGQTQPAPCVAAYALLDEMIALHARERADFHTVYLGLFSYDYETHGTEDGVAGIASGTTIDDLRQGTFPLGAVAEFHDDLPLDERAWPTPEDVDFMAEYFAQTIGCDVARVRPFVEYELYRDIPHYVIRHEVGHTMTLNHVDSVAQHFDAGEREPAYPHPRGNIGLVGYDIGRDHRFDPDCTLDFMAYTSLPWISDFGLQRLHDVMTDPGVPGFRNAQRAASPHLVALVRLGDTAASAPHFGWRAPAAPSRAHPAIPVRAETADGSLLRSVTGRLARFSHGRAGQLFVPEVMGAHHYVADLDGRSLTIAAALTGE